MSKLNKLSFGFSAMQSGQKSATVNAEPRLIASSTVGKFTATSPVTKVLGVAPGDNIMFLNNIGNIEAAINERMEDLVAWANENGVDINTVEGRDAILKEFTVWAIAKGVPMYDAKGNPVMASERYTKEDKQKYINENAQAILDANRDSLIERVGNPDASDDELIAAITVDDIESPKFHANTGSKTMTTGNATGVGCQVNFTDTNFWTALKSDLKDDKSKKNRVFGVVLKEDEELGLAPYATEIPNGKDMVKITAYPIYYIEDTDPIIRGEK